MFLTKRQSQLLDYLRKTIAVQGYAPSLEEMASHFKLSSVGTVHKHLKALEEKGYIQRQWNRSRAIEIVDMPDGKARRLPLLGRVAAGRPIEALTDSESIAIPEDLLGRGKAFVLQVRGNSMRDEAILDGDFVVVEQREEASAGETVVVLVDGESVTLKKYYPEEGRIRLQPANESMEPIFLSPDRCQIQGIVVGVLRRFAPQD